MTSDTELYRRTRRLLLAEAELFGSSVEGAVALRFDGVLVSINPGAPDRSMFNWVVPDSRSALLAAYDKIARRYVEAGVRAWTVFVDDGDVATEQELLARGHVLDAKPRAMACDIATMSLPEVGELDWCETSDIPAVAAINDRAYTFPPPAFAAALVRCVDPRWHAYLVHDRGQAVGCALTYESADGDCGISGVATLPEARGGGVASRLLAASVLAAAKRGATTTSLQATSKGAPVYARLGYRDLGCINMWEHRVPAPPAPAAR